MAGLGIFDLVGDSNDVALGWKNYDLQKEYAEKNIALQRQVNAQNQYNMEHAHQMEVKDLQAAGLNPVLSAYGQGAPVQTLQSAKVSAPQLNYDLGRRTREGLSESVDMLGKLFMMSEIGAKQEALANINASSRISAAQAHAQAKMDVAKLQQKGAMERLKYAKSAKVPVSPQMASNSAKNTAKLNDALSKTVDAVKKESFIDKVRARTEWKLLMNQFKKLRNQ